MLSKVKKISTEARVLHAFSFASFSVQMYSLTRAWTAALMGFCSHRTAFSVYVYRMNRQHLPQSRHPGHPPFTAEVHRRVILILAFQRNLQRNCSHLYFLPVHTRKGLQDWVQFPKAVFCTADLSCPPTSPLWIDALISPTSKIFFISEKSSHMTLNAFVLPAVLVEKHGLDPQKDHNRHVKTYLKLNLSLHSFMVGLEAFLLWISRLQIAYMQPVNETITWIWERPHLTRCVTSWGY